MAVAVGSLSAGAGGGDPNAGFVRQPRPSRTYAASATALDARADMSSTTSTVGCSRPPSRTSTTRSVRHPSGIVSPGRQLGAPS
jgi:hypothetical protein